MEYQKQTVGLNRNNIDKFYTSGKCVLLCINYIINNIIIDKNSDLIIEPSAGNGSFITPIKNLTTNWLFYDLKPENNEIIKQDFLTFDYKDINLNSNIKQIHIIGNPPFGRQSSLAIKFIKKSCEFCSTISFILPKSFKKNSLKKHFPMCFHLVLEVDLPDNSFLVDNVEYNVPCVFQIWIKKITNRPAVDKLQSINFKFVLKTENPDISFRRVGVNAGFIDTNIDKNIQSHYFIKFTNNKSIEDNLQKLSNIQFTESNTVGPRSISKQELIYKFNLCI